MTRVRAALAFAVCTGALGAQQARGLVLLLGPSSADVRRAADSTVLDYPLLSSLPADRRWIRLPGVRVRDGDGLHATSSVTWSVDASAFDFDSLAGRVRPLREGKSVLTVRADGISARVRTQVTTRALPPRPLRTRDSVISRAFGPAPRRPN
ncbi:MAG: hypothetical protein K2X99_09805 [Gemmatimonadaceae bacterium]|nr:hypothetical protein [Gemmatimonadaceae bacterium]